MFIDAVQRTELFHQLLCGFLAYLRHTGNVVRRIAHQGFQLNELGGCHAVSRFHILCIIILDFGFAALGLWNADFHFIRGNL